MYLNDWGRGLTGEGGWACCGSDEVGQGRGQEEAVAAGVGERRSAERQESHQLTRYPVTRQASTFNLAGAQGRTSSDYASVAGFGPIVQMVKWRFDALPVSSVLP
ncbi:unnamed protein product [Calypogeia fissa]